ncbi:MAG TPA: heavy metal translocating P-type ATPase [Lacipirellulaceae bacterium]|nr:heavy metal translocating P-type ATPase [Lacipirellulaceae bacterium]
MTQPSLKIELRLLLPEIPDARDACVRRLEQLIGRERGITRTHVVEAGKAAGGRTSLCLHYDPQTVSMAQVNRLARAAGADVTKQFGHATIPVRVVAAEDAARTIEQTLCGLPGVLSASVNQAAGQARVEFDRKQINLPRIEAAINEMGHAAGVTAATEAHAEGDGHEHRENGDAAKNWYARNRELVWSLIAGTLLVVAWTGERWLGLPRGVAIGVFAASYAFGAFDLVRHTLGTLRKGRFAFDIDLLMLLAAIGAAVLGAWAEGAFLLFLFSLAPSLEHYAMGKARDAIRALSDLAPPRARVLRDGREQEVPVGEVRVGEVVVVRPAERVTVDGLVKSGRSAIDQAPITGESVPVEKEVGDEVYAGTVNGNGAIEITSTRAAGDRTLDRVVKLVAEAQTQKAPTQQFTDRFERIFVPCVLVADVLLIVVPPLMGWWTWGTSFYRGMALLVAASPCALALGTPAAVLAGIAQAARNGVLIKGGAHLENLGTLQAIALDKTGTLTIGKPDVTDVMPAVGVKEAELLSVSAAVERRSQHPLAQAVVRRAEADMLQLPDAGELESLTARGVRSSVGGEVVEIGSLRLWEQDNVPVPQEIQNAVTKLKASGRSIIVIRKGTRFLGTLGVADQPRAGVRQTLDCLRAAGIRSIVMLTGDNRGVGDAIGKEVGVDEVKADLLPEDKVTAIRELLSRHGQVAMVGDGVNDAPALANATVGIAMGGAGTAVALETADVALMGDDLGKLPFAVALSRTSRGVIRQNLYLSLSVIAFLLVATVTGFSGLSLAVAVHEGSTLVVIANALRLLKTSTGLNPPVTA